LTKAPLVEDTVGKPPWLHALAKALVRAKVPDEDATNRIREVGARLLRSVWHRYQGDDAVRVTPYIDDDPCGQPFSPVALWHETTIFVRDGRSAKCFDAVVQELAKPFQSQAITEAVKACYERGDPFILDYVEEHFELDEAQVDDDEEILKKGTQDPPEQWAIDDEDEQPERDRGPDKEGDRNRHKPGDPDPDRGKRTPRSPGYEEFITYVGVQSDDAEADRDGPGNEARMELEALAIKFILTKEPRLQDTSRGNPGYDLFEADDAGEKIRWIEVKSMTGGWYRRPVGLSHTQFDYARKHREAYWIYVVEYADVAEKRRLWRIQDPAGKARTFTFDHGWLDIADADAAEEDRGD